MAKVEDLVRGHQFYSSFYQAKLYTQRSPDTRKKNPLLFIFIEVDSSICFLYIKHSKASNFFVECNYGKLKMVLLLIAC